jgi:hypothetical protein
MSNILLFDIVLVMAGLGLFFIMAAVQSYLRTQHTETIGVTVEAIVTGLRRERSNRNDSFYHVSYHAEVKNADGSPCVINKTNMISASGYISLSENGPVTIVYLPDNPQGTAQLSSQYGRGKFLKTGISGVGLTGGALLLFIFALNPSSSGKTVRPNAPTNAAATAQAIALAPIQRALSSYIPGWKEAPGQQSYTVQPADIGLDPSLGITEVDYGHCSPNGFYVYAVKEFQAERIAGIKYANAISTL